MHRDWTTKDWLKPCVVDDLVLWLLRSLDSRCRIRAVGRTRSRWRPMLCNILRWLHGRKKIEGNQAVLTGIIMLANPLLLLLSEVA